MKVLIEDIASNKEAWLAQKNVSIGSGDIAALVGADKRRSPLQLWSMKTGRAQRQEDNDYMWLGREMEPIIAKIAARKYGYKIDHCNSLFGHETLEWATATPDYFVHDGRTGFDMGVLECKNVTWRERSKWVDGLTPLGPRTQVLWQCGVLGKESGMVAPLIGCDIEEFEARQVDFDPDIFAQLVELGEKFLWHVKNDRPPAPTATDSKLVDDLVRRIAEKPFELPEPTLEEFTRYEQAKMQRDKYNSLARPYEEEMDAAKNAIRLSMGERRLAAIGPYRVKCTPVIVEPFMNKGSKYTKITISGGAL